MSPRDIIKEYIDRIMKSDSIYTQRITEIFNEEITDENIRDLETLINLLEIHEESFKQTRMILQLKQRNYLMKYMSEYALKQGDIHG